MRIYGLNISASENVFVTSIRFSSDYSNKVSACFTVRVRKGGYPKQRYIE